MKYDLNQYVEDAVRTESQVATVTVDPELLAGAMDMFIAAGNILDQIKKHVFYGQEFNHADMRNEFMQTVAALDRIKPAIQEPPVNLAGNVAVDPRTFHAVIGIATEASELMEALAVAFTDENVDNVNVLEEFGDLNWYQAIGIDALGGDFGNILDTNIEKLRARYPEKFSNEKAINRNIKREREILERNPLED